MSPSEHIWIIAGQSNATRRANEATLSAELAYLGDGYSVQYAEQSGCPEDDGAGSCTIETGWSTYDVNPLMGLEISAIRRLDELSRKTIRVITCATSGTDLADDWDPAATTGYLLYSRMVTFVNSLTSGLNARVEGILWVQGESDAVAVATDPDGYEQNLRAIIAAARSDFANPSLKFVVARLNANAALNATNMAKVIAAQKAVASDTKNVFLVNLDDIEMGGDGVHYTADSYVAIGYRMASIAMATTTFETIREQQQTLIRALTPTNHSTAAFRAYAEPDRFEDWVESKPTSCFRSYVIRDTFGYEDVSVADLVSEEVTTSAEIVIAYPKDGRFGLENAEDIRDLIREDMNQIKDAIGVNGYGNNVSGHIATWMDDQIELDEGENVWLLTMGMRVQFRRAI